MFRDLKFVFALLMLTFGCASLANKNTCDCVKNMAKISHQVKKNNNKKHRVETKITQLISNELVPEINNSEKTFTICVSLGEPNENDEAFGTQEEICYELIK